MTRRADPARIAHAQRAGLRARLVSHGVRETDVDAWLDAWERDNAGQFWDQAYDWIIGQVTLGKRPPSAEST